MTDGQRIMVAMAHPDDPEYGCAAAVAKWVEDGAEVWYVLATRGEAGNNSPDGVPWLTGRVREQEQRDAAAAVGVKTVEFFDFPDGRVHYGDELRLAFARQIRLLRPEIVVTLNFDVSWPGGNHLNQADHRHVGLAVLDATRDAANRWIYQQLLLEGLEPWEGAKHIYVAGAPHPDLTVSVTEAQVARAVQALQAHRSYISPEDAENLVRRSTQRPVQESDTGYGVSFQVLNV